MKHLYDMVITETNKDGKKFYQNAGKIFQRDDGTMCANLNLGLFGSKWVNFYTPKESDKPSAKSYLDDDIPFGN